MRPSFRKMELGEYSGTPLRRLRIQNLLLTENRFPPNLSIPDHAHSYPHLTIILDGSFAETYRFESFNCQKGSVLIVPQEQVHSDTVGENGAHSLSIEVSRSLERFLSSEWTMLECPRVIETPKLKPVIHRLRRVFITDPNSTLLDIHCAAMEVILAVAKEAISTQPATSWLQEILDYINCEYGRPIRLSELAEIAALSPEHLSRSFHKITGMTVKQYILETRLTSAERKLTETSNSLGEIAAACGFSDQAHLSRAFRAKFGIPPVTYRKEIR